MSLRLRILTLFITLLTAIVIEDCRAIEHRIQLDMPVTATADRVAGWLQAQGMTVEREEGSDHSIVLNGVSGAKERKWEVTILPRSVLGSVVIVEVEGEDPGLDELKASLGNGAGEALPEGADGETVVVPGPVLNRIESVACIYAANSRGTTVQFSGIFIDTEGLILSTAHDLLEQEHVSILTNTGIAYAGDVIKADFTRDLALIRVEQSKEVIVRINEGRNLLTVGERVYSIGCPMKLRGTIQSGYINGPPRKADSGFYWQADIEVQPGSSGSPVFVGDGSLVGMIRGRHREDGDIGFIIPLETVVDFLREYFGQ